MSMLKADNPVELAWGQGARLEQRHDGVYLIGPVIAEDELGHPVLMYTESHRFRDMDAAMEEAVSTVEWLMSLYWN